MSAAQPAETPRPLTRGEARRLRARREAWADMKATWRTEADLLRAHNQDWQGAVAAGQVRNRDSWNHLIHLGLTFLTGGLWLPVWVYVAVRDSRRIGRTGPGQRSKARRAAASAALKRERKQRRAGTRATR